MISLDISLEGEVLNPGLSPMLTPISGVVPVNFRAWELIK